MKMSALLFFAVSASCFAQIVQPPSGGSGSVTGGACPANQFANSISTSGAPSCTAVPATATTGFSPVATSGAYTDLSAKPTIPTVPATAAVLKGDGAGNATPAVAGTDFDAGGAATAVQNASVQRVFLPVSSAGTTAGYITGFDATGKAQNATSQTGYGGINVSTVTSGGTVEVQRFGLASVVFDGPSTIGNAVVPSVITTGQVHDSGVVPCSSILITSPIVGVVQVATTAAGQTGTVRLHGTGIFGCQQPAFTGDVSKPAGSYATTVTALNGVNLAGLGSGLYYFTSGTPAIASASQISTAVNSAYGFTPQAGTLTDTPITNNYSTLFNVSRALSALTSGAQTSTITFAPVAQAANTVFGNFTGSSATPTFSATPAFNGANITNLTATNLVGAVPVTNGGTGATTAAAALTNLGAQPAIGNLAAYTVYGNPTSAAAAPVGTTNPITITLSTNAASGNWYQGSAPGGTANCTQGTVTGCTAFITQTAAKTYAIGSTQGGNDGTIDALATQATKLATARAIAGVSFDGTAAIAIPSTGLSDSANLARVTTANAFGANQQSGSNYAITGGSVNGTTIGATTPSTGAFTYATSNLETVTFSATPTFSAVTGRSRIVLTANVTSSTLAVGVDGQRKCFDIAQNATGGFTFVFPTTVRGAGTIGTTPSKDNTQCFTYYQAATAWLSDGAMTINE